MADVGNRRTPSRPTYESLSRDEPAPGAGGTTGTAIAPPGSAVVSSTPTPGERTETL